MSQVKHYTLNTFIGPLQLQWVNQFKLKSIILPNKIKPQKNDELPEDFRQLHKELIDYFDGKQTSFTIDLLDLSQCSSFHQKVYKHIGSMPYGETLKYGEVAQAVGHKGAARAVGTAMARNPFPIVIPCHRILSSNGLGGYGGGLDMKRQLLSHERCKNINLI